MPIPRRKVKRVGENTYLQLHAALRVDGQAEAGGSHHQQIVGAVADGEDLREGDGVL